MSLLKTIRQQLGLSPTPANNFTLDASADNGTMKLARGNAGATTQDILTVDASGRVTMAQNGPTVLHKVLTWTSPATGNATTSTAHGLSDMTKIVGLTGVLHTTTGGVTIGNQNPTAGGHRLYALSFYWDSTNIYLRLADTCDPILVSRPVKVVLWYLP